MKKIGLFIFAVLAFVGCLLFPVASEAAVPQIQAEHQYFDVEKGLYVLNDNVVIAHKNRRVTAGEAKTNMMEVWADGGITFQQDDIEMSGSSLYADFSKNMVQVQGGVDFNRSNLRITADKVEFNWKTKLASFLGNVRVQQEGNASVYDAATYNVATNNFQ